MAGSLSVIALVIAVAAATWLIWNRPARQVPGDDPVLVEIPAGMTLAAAADTLMARGLLADRRVLLLGARLSGRANALKAGLYALSGTLSPRDLLDTLVSGRGVQNRVTIPEGLAAGEVADLVARELFIDPADFLAAADSLVGAALAGDRVTGGREAVARLDSLLTVETAARSVHLHRCEGYLAPDTYLFAAGTSETAVAIHLVDTQFARLEAATSRRRTGQPGGHGLLVLASIIEAEARRDDERERIAAVYSNRIDLGMRLEADPTVAHLLGKKGERLFYRDLAVRSAWNTYRVKGLPPGPIGSPGQASLQAAARPDSTCEALFFVADGRDGHVFSRTVREHEQAVRRFRALKSAERRNHGD